MKTKFMKKMIALICAAAMTTSCATASVGAVKEGYGVSSKDERDCINDIDQKVQLSINEIAKIMKKVEPIKGSIELRYTSLLIEDIYTILINLNDTKKFLKSTVNLELVDLGRIKAIKCILDNNIEPTLKNMNEYFSKHSNAIGNDLEDLVISLQSDSNHLKCDADTVAAFAKRLNEPSKKYRELDKAKRLIEQIDSSEEKARLEKICKDAEDKYTKIIHGMFYLEKQKDELVNLANGAISEINKALDSQKEEEKKREDERKNREMEEKIKQEEAAAKKQEEDLDNKKEELK